MFPDIRVPREKSPTGPSYGVDKPACLRCHRHKGPNVGSIDASTGSLVPLFDPRTQEWKSHFEWDGVAVRPLTAEGRVTVRILQLNAPDRLEERQRLFEPRGDFESAGR